MSVDLTKSFEVKNGLSLSGLVSFFEGIDDPTAGGGIAANLGSVYIRYGTGVNTIYQKTDTLATDWTLLGGGIPGGSDTQIQYNNSSVFGGSAGFTFNDSTGLVTITKAGTAKADLILLDLTNSGNDADMDGTGTSIQFNQFYYDGATPAKVDAGKISVITETDWTSTGSTQNSYMSFLTAFEGAVAEKVKITSGGDLDLVAHKQRLLIHGTNALYIPTTTTILIGEGAGSGWTNETNAILIGNNAGYNIATANGTIGIGSDALKGAVKNEKAEVIIMNNNIEAQIAEMESAEDKQLFMEEYKMTEPALDRLIHSAYKLLNLYTYFTAGVQEVRAWTIYEGWKAPQAAGVIHTDFEKGFIKAEVISYNDFIHYGSEAACREVGKLRIEGKEYVVKDGDVMHFRFNV